MQDWDSIHIEGMGWLGSLLATELDARGIPFTWNELQPADPWYPAAWQASSGLIYPSGDERSAKGYELWASAWHMGTFEGYITRSAFYYTTKSHPNGLAVKPERTVGAFNVSPFPAYSIDVPRFVRYTRERFYNKRTSMYVPKRGIKLVRAHASCYRYAWGWTAPVILTHTSESGPSKPLATYYMREGRFKLAYAIARYNSPYHIAGSDHIATTKPKEYDTAFILGKLQAWGETVKRASKGELLAVYAEPPTQGWRPLDMSDEAVGVYQDSNIRLPAMGSSGVRHGLLLMQDVMLTLGCDSRLKIVLPDRVDTLHG